MACLTSFIFPPFSSHFLAALSLTTLVTVPILGIAEIRGKHLQYSKFLNAGKSSQKIRIPSRIGMLLCYTPAFVAGILSFLIFPQHNESRILITKSALLLHFFKRIFESPLYKQDNAAAQLGHLSIPHSHQSTPSFPSLFPFAISMLPHTVSNRYANQNTRISLLKFNALWEAYYRQDSVLVFSTGRSPESYRKLRREKPILTPDITIMSVGTEIAYGDLMVEDEEWERFLNQNWNRDIVIEETLKFPQLTLQSKTEQRPHKVSFFIEKDEAPAVAKALSESLENRGLDVKVIYSSGIALDILPKGAGKGEALAYILKKFKADGKVPVDVLVCGYSGNDAELFSVPNVYGVMVSNAQEELLQWYMDNAKDNTKIIHGTERCAGGIIQAITTFQLGPNLSPRDMRDFKGCRVETINPGYEVVKFYLLSERWRRAEVEKSELYLQKLKSIFYQPGIVVHPSGFERPSHQCIDKMSSLYGDKKGTRFQIWVDRVSSAQTGSDTWLVRFDKWELSGNKLFGCLTTVLMSLQSKVSDGLIWMHLHQTWLDGSEQPQDQTTWLF